MNGHHNGVNAHHAKTVADVSPDVPRMLPTGAAPDSGLSRMMSPERLAWLEAVKAQQEQMKRLNEQPE